MLPKPAKDPHKVTSYRPISLLLTMSRILEKIMLRRIKTIIMERKLIPNHQFGFRNKQVAIQQVYRLVNKIITSLENKTYCTAAFLDVEKAFDKV